MTQNEDDYRKRIAQLEEENTYLRRSAEQFGRLAERLNSELIEERRVRNDRRQAPRGHTDRRLPPRSQSDRRQTIDDR